jgi:hypothetical protein
MNREELKQAIATTLDEINKLKEKLSQDHRSST